MALSEHRIRDIRDHLPKTPQTDPNKFPPYKFRPYPRQMKDANGKPLRGADGQPINANSEAEENRIMGKPLNDSERARGIHELHEVDAEPQQAAVRSGAPELLNKKPATKLPPNLK